MGICMYVFVFGSIWNYSYFDFKIQLLPAFHTSGLNNLLKQILNNFSPPVWGSWLQTATYTCAHRLPHLGPGGSGTPIQIILTTSLEMPTKETEGNLPLVPIQRSFPHNHPHLLRHSSLQVLRKPASSSSSSHRSPYKSPLPRKRVSWSSMGLTTPATALPVLTDLKTRG